MFDNIKNILLAHHITTKEPIDSFHYNSMTGKIEKFDLSEKETINEVKSLIGKGVSANVDTITKKLKDIDLKLSALTSISEDHPILVLTQKDNMYSYYILYK